MIGGLVCMGLRFFEICMGKINICGGAASAQPPAQPLRKGGKPFPVPPLAAIAQPGDGPGEDGDDPGSGCPGRGALVWRERTA